MHKARWLAGWAGWSKSAGKPVFYHVISRVVDRRFVFGPEEKEKFRALMRMQEKFSGCRVVSYCLMIHGMSHFRFAPDGRICEQRDHWDASFVLYGEHPVVRWMMEQIKRKAQLFGPEGDGK